MANERLDRFTKLLKEIFELDKSDLDFGIYRVMNLRKTQIEEFLTQRLPQMVQETLAPFAQGSKEEIRAQMAQIEENVAGMHMLSGLVFCGDCGNKMYHVRCKGWDHSQEYFTCATDRKQRGGCTSHQIKTEVIEQIVLAQLQSIIRFASEREAEFTEMVMQRSQKARSTELRDKKKEYDQSKARAAKLDQIMQRLYEDNISGKISDERFAKLSETYEAEQKQLILRIAELDTFFAKDQEQAVNLKTFMQHVKRYTNLDHLDAEVLRTFIKRIVVTDTMPGKKGKGIEVKLEYTIDGEYKTYPDQQDRKTA